MLVTYCWLCRHCRNLAEGGCLLSQFHFTRCRYFLGHVAYRNLPWQGLYIPPANKTPPTTPINATYHLRVTYYVFFTHPKDSFKMSVIDEEKHKQALNSTFINSEALSHFNLLKKEQMFLVQQLLH